MPPKFWEVAICHIFFKYFIISCIIFFLTQGQFFLAFRVVDFLPILLQTDFQFYCIIIIERELEDADFEIY